jgi:sugar phosphate isomerase/epimerase
MAEVPILGSFWTLAAGTAPTGPDVCSHDIRTRIEVAAKVGFTGMGLWHTDIQAIQAKTDLSEVKRMLDDNGIVHIEVEWLNDWFYSDERRAESDEWRALLLDAAEALGARHIKIADLANDTVSVEEMIPAFAQLCAEAAERGTNIVFEMLPGDFSNLPSLDHVLQLTRGSGAKNGGIMIDNLHVQRTGTSFADLEAKLTPDDVIAVEINDGALARPVAFEDSVINRRMLPGDGEFDIAGFLHAIWNNGYDGPIGVEVINEYMRYWPLETTAEVSFAKTAEVINAARASWQGK